jgi:hypothetical protein
MVKSGEPRAAPPRKGVADVTASPPRAANRLKPSDPEPTVKIRSRTPSIQAARSGSNGSDPSVTVRGSVRVRAVRFEINGQD